MKVLNDQREDSQGSTRLEIMPKGFSVSSETSKESVGMDKPKPAAFRQASFLV
jgi:hypothetical protein